MKAFEKIARFSDLGGVIGNQWLGTAQEGDGSAPVDLHWSDVLALVSEIKAEYAINQRLSGENETLIEMCVKARAETDRLRAALEEIKAEHENHAPAERKMFAIADLALNGGA